MHLQDTSPPPSMIVGGRAGGQTTPTDPRSRRNRASRRGVQLLTRAQSPANMNGLPDLRLLPDAPVPDGRTVLPTRTPSASRRPLGHGRHLAQFIPVTNLLERSLAEVKRRSKVIGRFPGETSCLTLVWAVLDLYITHATNGVRFSQLERQHLRRLRHARTEQTTDQEVSAA